jgi:hypothetical protein
MVELLFIPSRDVRDAKEFEIEGTLNSIVKPVNKSLISVG